MAVRRYHRWHDLASRRVHSRVRASRAYHRHAAGPVGTCHVRELLVSDGASAWQAAGFSVERAESASPFVRVGGDFTIHLGCLQRSGAGRSHCRPRGIVGWGLRSLPLPVPGGAAAACDSDIDGIASYAVPGATAPATHAAPARRRALHPNCAIGVDHIVVRSDDWVRTDAALSRHGFTLRRRRDDVYPGITQLFYRSSSRCGDTSNDSNGNSNSNSNSAGPIVELVAPTTPSTKGKAAPAPTAFVWGVTFVVADIAAAKNWLGDRAGDVRSAVQPGRHILVLRRRHAGVNSSVNIAFMTQHVKC